MDDEQHAQARRPGIIERLVAQAESYWQRLRSELKDEIEHWDGDGEQSHD